MAKVSHAVVDELPPEEVTDVTDVDEVEGEPEDKQVRHREKWQGGYNAIFDTKDECLHAPVLTEQGEETDTFSIYVVLNNENQKKTYTWARNNQEGLVNYIDANFDLTCSKLDAKRGRAKMFKADPALVQLAESLKLQNDSAAIANFLQFLPLYQYVFDGSEMPTKIG